MARAKKTIASALKARSKAPATKAAAQRQSTAAPLVSARRPPVTGELAPFFTVASDVNPTFAFGTVGGRWIVLAFLGSLTVEPMARVYEQALKRRAVFNDDDAALFVVTLDGSHKATPGNGLRHFIDRDRAVSQLYGVADDERVAPTIFLLDRALRVVANGPADAIDAVIDRLTQEIAAEKPVLYEQSAPILTIPRIFEPALCTTLIDYYRRTGGQVSGFMREVDGRTRLLHDENHKRRKDVTIEDEALKAVIKNRIERRLLPMVERAFQWKATQMERYLVACYADEEQGFFRAHRDNTTSGTAHRKFAVSINLNADYDGGRLRFPEYGTRTYKPVPGGATVFSCSLLHEATPVTRGERFVFVPFLYDEEGEEIRARNLDKLEMSDRPEAPIER